MKLSTTSHTLTATSAGASQALSAGCTQVSVFAEAAMDIGVVPGTVGAISLTTLATHDATTAKSIGIDFTGTFGVGDVIRITIDGNNVDLTVGADNQETCASDYKTLAAANGTIAAAFDLSVSQNRVTVTHKTVNTDFTISSTVNSRNIPHHIGANERLTLEVPPGSTIRAKASSGTLNISEL
jgi:phage tail sheath gpL-like